MYETAVKELEEEAGYVLRDPDNLSSCGAVSFFNKEMIEIYVYSIPYKIICRKKSLEAI